MFSGIVETIGTINELQSYNDCMKLTISPGKVFTDVQVGDSIAVNGVCLTITHHNQQSFDATVVPETMRRTNLDQLTVGAAVNLERSLKVGSRNSGHYVQGHVDDIGEIIELCEDGLDALILKINTPQQLSKYIVKKGYVTLDGMSITVIDVVDNLFTVTLIPHTQNVSIAKYYSAGRKINIEIDITAKYIEKLLLRSQ